MFKNSTDKNRVSKKILVQSHNAKRKIPCLLVHQKNIDFSKKAPGVLWIHGGGYVLGMKEMVFRSRAMNLVEDFGAVVLSPGYRLSFQAPFPAAIEDCYDALLWLKEHAEELNIDPDLIIVGGESAGGGLCAALCMMARDKGDVKIAYQLPLYPMIDNFDTKSSIHNRGKVWNTKKNHIAWKMYLREDVHKEVSPYAAPARQTDYSNLPPTYTFVGTGEPFYCETLKFIENLKAAGVDATVDIYETDMHAFDMMNPDSELGKQAIANYIKQIEKWIKA